MIDIDEIRKQVAIKNDTILSKDDPILATVTINEFVLDHYLKSVSVKAGHENQELIDNLQTVIQKTITESLSNRAACRKKTSYKIMASIALAGVLLTASSIYFFRDGYQRAEQKIHTSMNGLQDAFRNGNNDAKTWLNLIHLNDIKKSMTSCHGDKLITNDLGQTGCLVPLWITSPKNH